MKRKLSSRLFFLTLALLLVPQVEPALAQSRGDAAPETLGATANRARVESDSRITVQERSDNVTKKGKQRLSEREKRELNGRRLSRSEIQRVLGERSLSGALNQEIKYAEGVLKKLGKDSPQRPRILQRLVEKYHEKSLLVFFAESRKYDLEWTRWDKGGRKGREPTLDTKKSLAWTSKVVQKAQQMITEYPKDREIDEAYFQIAYAMEVLEKRREAAAYYSQIVAKFPNSPRIADAHFALGEYYFDMTDFPKALTSFKEATKHTRSSIYPWAVYKMAWCYYNLKDYRNSLGAFQNVVRISAQAPKLTAEGRKRLKEEALRDMINPYAELRDIDGAERYFSQVGGQKYFGELLTKLAEALREQGLYPQSIAVLKRFISRNASDVSAADIQIQIVDTANLIADKKMLWAELSSLLKNYSPDSLWGKRNENHPDFEELSERVHAVAINYPKQMHAEAQKNKNRYLYGQAAMGYQLYLSVYGSRPEATEISFLLGEIYYQQEQFPKARETFKAIAQKEREKKGQYFAKAAQYMLSASYIPIEQGMGVLRKSGAKLRQPQRPIPAPVQEYLKSCELIVGWFPNSKSVKDCELDKAEIFLKHNHYESAEKELWSIAKKYSNEKAGKDAAELLLWLASNDNQKLVRTSNELAKIAAYKKGEIGKRLQAIDETNRFAQTLELEKSGDNLKAAVAFEKLARANPQGAEADKAWYNAGVNYRKAGEPDKALAAFNEVITDHAKTSQAPDATLAVVEIYDEQLNLAGAAKFSTLFLERYGQDKRFEVVRREACLLYAALNDIAGSQKTCGLIIKSKGQDVALAAQALADLYRRSQRYGDLIAITDTYLLKLPVTSSEKIVYLAHAAEAEAKMGQGAKVRGRESQIKGFFGREKGKISGEALSIVGGLEFRAQAGTLEKFRATKIVARKQDGSDLMASITTKGALLKNVEQSYQKVLQTGDAEWGVAALYTIAGAYEIYANDLKEPPKPPGVQEKDFKPIRDELAKLSAGPASKALEFYKQAAESVAKFGVYTDYSQKNAAALARLDPKNFRQLQEWVPETIFVGSRWTGGGAAGRVFPYLGE